MNTQCLSKKEVRIPRILSLMRSDDRKKVVPFKELARCLVATQTSQLVSCDKEKLAIT